MLIIGVIIKVFALQEIQQPKKKVISQMVEGISMTGLKQICQGSVM